jgi:hypothetical protein
MLTANDIKQEVSYLYLHALVTRLGYSLERTCIDRDSVDATICSRGIIPGSKGNILSPKIDVQLKASAQECSGSLIPFGISRKNYDDLRQNSMVPKLLIVLFLPEDGVWLDCDLEKIVLYGKSYWMSLKGMSATGNALSVTVYLNQSQRLTVEMIQEWMVAAANREDISHVSC